MTDAASDDTATTAHAAAAPKNIHDGVVFSRGVNILVLDAVGRVERVIIGPAGRHNYRALEVSPAMVETPPGRIPRVARTGSRKHGMSLNEFWDFEIQYVCCVSEVMLTFFHISVGLTNVAFVSGRRNH